MDRPCHAPILLQSLLRRLRGLGCDLGSAVALVLRDKNFASSICFSVSASTLLMSETLLLFQIATQRTRYRCFHFQSVGWFRPPRVHPRCAVERFLSDRPGGRPQYHTRELRNRQDHVHQHCARRRSGTVHSAGRRSGTVHSRAHRVLFIQEWPALCHRSSFLWKIACIRSLALRADLVGCDFLFSCVLCATLRNATWCVRIAAISELPDASLRGRSCIRVHHQLIYADM